jgi:hypothetical protein
MSGPNGTAFFKCLNDCTIMLRLEPVNRNRSEFNKQMRSTQVMTMSTQNSFVAPVSEYGEESLIRHVYGNEKPGKTNFYVSQM